MNGPTDTTPSDATATSTPDNRRISEVTRRDVFDALIARGTAWAGRLDEVEFLARIFDLTQLPSTDHRHEDAAGDIWRHRVANPGDWPNDWILSDERFALLHCPDDIFLRFLSEMLHPAVRADAAEVDSLLRLLNPLLAVDGFEMAEVTRVSGRPVFIGRPMPPAASSVSATYRDIGPIGSGGYGKVWLCERVADGEQFARKTLVDQDPEGQRRFSREVRILQGLHHPHIVAVLFADLSAQPPFYVMPRYRCSLEDELTAIVGDESRIRPIFERMLEAIAYAHAQGVLHRDLKPLNVLLNSDTDVVLSDFGLGRRVDATTTRQTLTGRSLGTFLYMAPEQMTDAKMADERADVYALGRILWELYAGTDAIVTHDYSSLPPAIAVLVRRCTDKDPEKRFQHVVDLQSAWGRIFDTAARSTELSELRTLLAELRDGKAATASQLEAFVSMLASHLDDKDFVCDAVMEVDPVHLHEAFQRDPRAVTSILLRFVDIVVGQSWPFDFTDKLGARCKILYELLADFELRAALAWAAAELGLSHNRFRVLGLTAAMLELPKQPGETLPLVERFERFGAPYRKPLLGYLSLSRLHPDLVPLFTFES